MRITKIQVENFKRFTDLTIQYIPDTSKLVLLIGANGSGKSTVFDAFEQLVSNEKHGQSNRGFENEYYRKDILKEFDIEIKTSNGESFVRKNLQGFDKSIKPHFFYGRPSLRIVPTINNVNLNEKTLEKNTDT